MEDNKRSTGYAIDDGRIQEGSYQIRYHYMSEACVMRLISSSPKNYLYF